MPQQSLGMFGGTQIFTSPSPRARGFGLSMNRNSTKKKGSPPGLPFHASNYHFIYYFFLVPGFVFLCSPSFHLILWQRKLRIPAGNRGRPKDNEMIPGGVVAFPKICYLRVSQANIEVMQQQYRHRLSRGPALSVYTGYECYHVVGSVGSIVGATHSHPISSSVCVDPNSRTHSSD